MVFLKEIGDIYRLKVPFDGEVYTSVFLIKHASGNLFIDCATTPQDVDGYIIPALQKEGLSLADIRYLVLTHQHSDHAGGRRYIVSLEKGIKVIESVDEKLPNGITMYAMKGHTLDSIGVFDEATGTLVAGDGLQGYGVGKYRCSLESREEYLITIEKIKSNPEIQNILFSHAYEPWYKDGAFGRREVEKCLQDCIEYVDKE